jgi:hypothetical protein
MLKALSNRNRAPECSVRSARSSAKLVRYGSGTPMHCCGALLLPREPGDLLDQILLTFVGMTQARTSEYSGVDRVGVGATLSGNRRYCFLGLLAQDDHRDEAKYEESHFATLIQFYGGFGR